MDTLIQQLAAARDGGFAAPLLLVTGASAMPVRAAKEQWPADRALTKHFAGLRHCGMVTMVVTGFQTDIILSGCFDRRQNLPRGAAKRLFHEHMLSSRYRAKRDFRGDSRRRGADNNV